MLTPLAAMVTLFAVPEPMPLEGLIAFSDPVRCEAAAPFRKMLDGLWRTRNKRPAMRSIPSAYRPAFGDVVYSIGNNGFMSTAMEITGTWHGTPLLGFALSKMQEANAPTLELHFGVPMAAARDALFARGFRFGVREGAPRVTLRPNLGDDSTTILSCEPNG